MDVLEPKPVALLPEEADLYRRVNFNPHIPQTFEEAAESRSAAAELARSLLRRNAIPSIRLLYFTDPALNIGGRGKSRKDVFEDNNCRGDAILEHGHFLKYLRYFILGPNLPAGTVNRFRQVILDDLGTSGELLDALRLCARAEARRLKSPQVDLREEFFKLALECGLDDTVAISVREAVGSVE